MTYEQAAPYVGVVVDDSGNGRMTTIQPIFALGDDTQGFFFVIPLDDDDAIDIAMEYLTERKWFGRLLGTMDAREPEYLIR